MSIDKYWSKTLGHVYIDSIKEDMNKFSEIAKEIGTTPENVLLYIIAERLGSVYDGGEVDDICDSLDEIKDSLNTVVDALKDMKSED